MNTPELPADTVRERTQAPYHYTAAELGELGKKLANTRRDAGRLEAELSSIKKDYSSRLETVELEQDSICRKLEDGFEMREAMALVTMNDPATGRKTYRHEASGEVIREEAMSFSDSAPPLFRNGDNQDATAPGADEETQTEQPNDEPSEEDIAAATDGKPAVTSVGTALDQAASVSEAPLLNLDLTGVTAEGHLLTMYNKAAKAAGWTTVQISMLKTQLQACETVSRMKECLQPHCAPIAE